MAQVPAAVPVRPNTHYFSLENKGAVYDEMLRQRELSMEVPTDFAGLKVELFCLTK